MNRQKILDPRLYLVSGSNDTRSRSLVELVEQAAEGGITLFQLREKTMPTGEFINTARQIVAALEATDIPVLINDRVDVALAAGAAGIHLGQSDISATDARKILGPEAIIGLTVRDQNEIDQAPVELLDYLSIGGVFTTSSKDNARSPIGIDGLQNLVGHARSRCKLPLTAIAGINRHQIEQVFTCGVDGVALISAITHAEKIEAATQTLRQQVDAALQQQRKGTKQS